MGLVRESGARRRPRPCSQALPSAPGHRDRYRDPPPIAGIQWSAWRRALSGIWDLVGVAQVLSVLVLDLDPHSPAARARNRG